MCAAFLLMVGGAGLIAPAASAQPVGSVVSTQTLPKAQLPSAAAHGVRILYTTRSQSGRPAKSYGAVYYPAGKAPAGGWKIFSWAHGTSGISENCAPSRSAGSERDRLEPTINKALRAGYVVTSSDYIGLGGGDQAEYLGGRSEGQSVLDMLRAARANDRQISTDWVSSGHSQGGHAALWASWLAAGYLPNFRLHGTAVFAPASNIEMLFSLFGPGFPSNKQGNALGGMALYGVDGLNVARPELHVLDYLSPRGRELAQRVKTMCVFDTVPLFTNTPVGALFSRSLSEPKIAAAFKQYLAVPTAGYGSPVRINQGTSDMVVIAPMTLKLVADMRLAGTDVNLAAYPGADHMSVLGRSNDATIDTVRAYFRS